MPGAEERRDARSPRRPRTDERIRAAEVIAALSLATDLGIGIPLEHGLQSTLVAMRLATRLGVDAKVASQVYYTCLLFYVGCTANAELADEIFGGHDVLTAYGGPVRYGSRAERAAGLLRAVAPPTGTPMRRARQLANGLPKLARVFPNQVAELCEVAQMLTDRLGLPAEIGALFVYIDERWDGKGDPGHVRGEAIPLAVRIVQVARDAWFQSMVGGSPRYAARVIRRRGGGAFDPAIARPLADEPDALLGTEAAPDAWEQTLACEPAPQLVLGGEAIDRALAAIGDFADLASPFLVGHSAGVARLAAAAGRALGLGPEEVTTVGRAALVHDIGRVAVPVGIWQKPGPLTTDEWERVRLHPYHTERVIGRSSFLAALAPISTFHHERLDGSGYHRGVAAGGINRAARLLAAADAYHAMTEPRPHRPGLSPADATARLAEDAGAGRFDSEAVKNVVAAAGQPIPLLERPAGLTEREAQVIGLLARGYATKQVAATLDISVKTADRHVQNAYAKIGVSSRAAAALFAMEHGLVMWGELPISGVGRPR
jgi:HD-GYP domain-containing protein (c-di-GMP phosphodiesterase class II)